MTAAPAAAADAGDTIGRLADDAERTLGDRTAAFRRRAGRWEPATWNDMRALRREVAAGLAAEVAPGTRVAVISGTRFEWGPIDLAILTLGAVTVGIYPTSTPAQVDYVLRHSRSRVVIVEDLAQLERLRETLAAAPEVRLVVVIDAPEAAPDRAITLEALRARGRERLAAEPELPERRGDAVRPSDVATLVYTSGTTGPPKAVALTHGALVFTSRLGSQAIGATADDVAVSYLPMSHVFTRVNYYGYLQIRGTAWFAESLEKVGEAWAAAHPTALAAVPRVLEKAQARIFAAVAEMPRRRQRLFARAIAAGKRRSELVERREPIPVLLAAECRLWDRLVYRKLRARLGWERVRFALSGGAPLRPEVARFFDALGILVVEGFGMTETASPISLNRPEPGGYRIGTVGRPLPGIEVEIAPDGEILVRSPGLFLRYEGDEAATRAAFDERGFFRTGDVGAIDEDGFLRITDRKRDLIITSGGKNVAPLNIEALLKEDPRISQAAVFGERRPYLVALLTLAPEELARLAIDGVGPLPPESRAHAMVADIVARANARLAPFETIKRFRVLAEDFTVENDLLTATLKVKRRAVGQRYAALIDSLYE